ncbi:MAG TPA: nucleoside deaminase [Pyrinomonadaceae bacterium]|nr:nucleoside deaminase [Pyrinomonadaceae bacterium]
MKSDEDFMSRCLELGRAALAVGDAPVGTLIVIGGKIIAEGIEAVRAKNDPTAHAEIEAVRLACKKLNKLNLSGSTLYTNVEPCVMCAFAIRQTGIREVVFGLSNSDVGGATSKFPVLTDSDFPAKHDPPEIRAGVLRAECKQLLREFRALRKVEK